MNRRQFLVLSTAAASTTRAGAQNPDIPLISFGLTTDVQYTDADPQGERHYRESMPKLKAAVADLAKEKLPFTLHLGDAIDRDFASFPTILPLFEPLGHPVRHLLGNHDYSVAENEKSKVISTLGMPGDYYTFENAGVKFVMLDTNEISSYKFPQGSSEDLTAEEIMKQSASEKSSNNKPSIGGVSATQLDWLENELKESDAAKTPVIVCGHHPLLPATGHQAWNSQAISAVIKRHPCVRAYFCGHNHAGAEVIENGVPYITFKSILHEPNITAYAVVRLFKDKLVIEGRGRELSRVIPLAVG
ncbi:MAG: metallophosphoesterase [Gloeobacteraceae cyanobacterium ES-bin-144]|nr:metallophosphoesterase [Verrucomicrobiales bacterium]